MSRSAAPGRAYYPVFLDLRGRPCTVVGGDRAARAKVEALLAAGARATVIAPELEEGLAALAAAGAVRHRARGYRPGDLAGAFLAISVLADPEVDQRLWEEAEALGIPVNVMDDVPRCSFIAPSVVRQGELVVAVSTSGRAPALAVRLRQRLERDLGPEYARFLELAGALRAPLAEAWPDFEERRRRWYRLVDSDVLELLARGEEAAARRRIEEITGVAPPPAPAETELGRFKPPPAPAETELGRFKPPPAPAETELGRFKPERVSASRGSGGGT